jgi:hypothetical protein
MAEFKLGLNAQNAEQCRQILAHLPGVFAAGLRFDEQQLVEIHILASTERNPKQIARDVQSALFAAYGTEVDHRIISIAQLPEDPFLPKELTEVEAQEPRPEFEPVQNIRLLFTGIDTNLKNGTYQVKVHLSHEDKSFTGEAKCRDTNIQRSRTIATATLDAVHAFLNKEYFSLLEVKQINIWGVTVVITVIEYQEDDQREPLILIGSAVQHDNASVGIVRSTLDALNRSISKLC